MIIGISKEDLIKIYQEELGIEPMVNILWLADFKCKELSPWLAIDEFKNSGFVGLCWILTKDGDVFAHNFDGEYFINPYMPNYPIHEETVRSVMPIKTPEAPK